MHRRLQERLVGAVVLVLAAVLILPAVLSGPPAKEEERPVEAAGEPRQRTHTIRLDVPQPARPAQETTPAPLPEPPAVARTEAPAGAPDASVTEATPEPGKAPEAAVARAEPDPGPAPAASAPPPEEKKQPPPPAPAPATTAAAPATVARADASAKPAGAGWAVQVGNFASKANADRLTATLQRAGHAAFVMPRTSDGNTTYRVRVGPASSLEDARVIERKLEGEGHPADVVRHP